MASFTTSSNVSSNLVGRELSIASSFVKQYYTLLNKAPCFIHNFYSHDSTFIHGTIEMANEPYTEPVVGREKIKKKMEELELNDCRAKIKQIDCLETLAGGLVIQVIGELSNNGRPMRRFLQTFVLAPSPDDARQDGDQQARAGNTASTGLDRRGVQLSGGDNSSSNHSTHNQKFFVLNSIFRYQDDGPESELEDEVAGAQVSAPTDNINGGYESKQETVGDPEVVSNGTGNLDKKNETSEKSTENVKMVADLHSQQITSAVREPSPTATNQPTSTTLATKTQPSNEPKTWANMVRNAHPPSASVQVNVNKATPAHPVEQQQQQQLQHQQQQHHQPPQQQQQQQIQQQPQQQPQQPQQPQQQQPLQQQQQQPSQQLQQQPQQPATQASSVQTHQLQQQSPQQQQQNLQNNPNRRRHIMRKPNNKTTGRSIKNRPRPPATEKPVA